MNILSEIERDCRAKRDELRQGKIDENDAPLKHVYPEVRMYENEHYTAEEGQDEEAVRVHGRTSTAAPQEPEP